MDFASWLSLGTLVTLAIGLGVLAWHARGQRRMRRAEYGNVYIQRHWQIEDDVLVADEGSPQHQMHLQRYLRLLEDEFDAATLRFLDLPQWAVWHGVLDDDRARQRVTEALHACDPAAGEFRRLKRCLAQRERDRARHDISRCKATQVYSA
ncbi:hypothetical protein ASF37_10185 [Aeromicrobium sp. Leaf289]|uniref:hypothetical protein n=1 Tax=Aeromicrobium sp. Leaf289 TaxID=1736324 RepID=UPI0006F73DD8|nr:hypothetical protein [Aeromicrobium sp. Leaf289]KQP78861.1 hypothetical protein ASF37_10185 [Aeromicrobium sp. Leaf289]